MLSGGPFGYLAIRETSTPGISRFKPFGLFADL